MIADTDTEVINKYELRYKENKRGLYATERIRQGEVIISLPLITQDFPDRFSVEASPGNHINCTYSPVGAINHSCNPNSAVRNFRIVAWQCIEPGEEITIDYKKTEEKLACPFICHCRYCPPGTRIE